MSVKDPSRSVPTVSSPAESWIQWHRDLRKVFGKKQANSIWVYAWSKRGGEKSPANTRSLRSYMESQGVDISRTTLSGVGDSLANFGSGIGSFVKWTLVGSLVLGGVLVVAVAYNVVKNPTVVNQVASSSPKGRVSKSSSKLLK